jgi:O-antigen/teichoic acid export membrane protein
MMKKILTNIGWLFFDKILRLGIGLVVVMWLARYLGPEQFGQLNFVVALVAVFGVFATLGLKGIVVRDLLDQPDEQKVILGSAFVLKIVAALAVYLLLIMTIFILKPDDVLSKSMIAVLGLSIVFKSTEVVNFWFESQVKSKYVVWVENGVFLAIALVKMIMLWQQAPLIAFVWVMLLESIVVGIVLLFVYAKVVMNPKHWHITRTRVKSLLQDSWPLIISSAAWIVYTRIDQIMIGQMLNDQALGYYSVAIKLSEMANIVPIIIAFSIIPALTALRKTDVVLYRHRFQMTYDTVVGLMLLAAITITFLSDFIITLLFGSAYVEAAPVLTIHIWSAIFIAMATVSGKYLINEGLQKITMQRHLTGVLINIPLNFVLIPIYGIEGAAYASLFSLAFSNYIYDAISPATRFCFVQKTRSFIGYGLITNLWNNRTR